MTHIVKKGATITLRLTDDYSFTTLDGADRDCIELQATETVRNNGEVILTGEIRVEVEE